MLFEYGGDIAQTTKEKYKKLVTTTTKTFMLHYLIGEPLPKKLKTNIIISPNKK